MGMLGAIGSIPFIGGIALFLGVLFFMLTGDFGKTLVFIGVVFSTEFVIAWKTFHEWAKDH